MWVSCGTSGGAFAALFFSFTLLAMSAEAQEAQSSSRNDQPTHPIKVLLLTGQEYHDWRSTAPVLADILKKDPRLSVTVVEDPSFLASPDIHTYDVIFNHWMNWQVPAPGQEARENLSRFVAEGKGLVFIHFACGEFQDWPEFKDISGRAWDPQLRPHDPLGLFEVKIEDATHPITQGLASFETQDELYTCLIGDKPIHLLATARSKVDQLVYPMAFVLDVEKGRVFHCVLGHDVKALEPEPLQEMLRRGTLWVAGPGKAS